ncbi:MAG: hypothetical protein OXL96_18175 [Candidatus Poribacteria bacterium]|nr:hypothetical protein [Candidatus Poribacteria bacterium]
MEPKHIHRYMIEVSGRLNLISSGAHGAADKMAMAVRHMAGKRLTYKQLIAENTLFGG